MGNCCGKNADKREDVDKHLHDISSEGAHGNENRHDRHHNQSTSSNKYALPRDAHAHAHDSNRNKRYLKFHK